MDSVGKFLILYLLLKELFKAVNKIIDFKINKPRHAKKETGDDFIGL